MRSVVWRAAAALVVSLLAATIAAPAVAQTEEELEAAFLEAVSALDARVAVLVTDVEAANSAWDNREATIDATLTELTRVEAETNAIATELAVLVPPADLEGEHGVMLDTLNQMAAAAADMIAGLRGSDTGEARQAAAIAFLAAGADFSDLAFLVQGGAEPTTTTTTTLPPDTTSSTAVPATTATTEAAPTTSTTAAVAQAEPDDEGDGSGAPWLLLPVVMVAGIVLGLGAGLLIGRRARFELIDTIRRLRAGDTPPHDEVG